MPANGLRAGGAGSGLGPAALLHLLEASPDAIVTVDGAQRIRLFNAAAERMFGRPAAAVLGEPLWRLLPAAARHAHERHVEIFAATGVASRPMQGDEVRGRRADGTEFPVEVSIGRIATPEGTFLTATLRERRLDAPLEPARRYRQIAESLPLLVWTCTPDGKCDYLGPQWLAYTGLPASEQLGYGWLERLHPEDRASTQEAWEAAATSGEPFRHEFRIQRHDGLYRWFRTLAKPLRNSEGAILRWFGSNTDIDDLRQSQDRLALSEERLAGAIHAADLGVWELDLATGRFTDWNARHDCILGRGAGGGSWTLADFEALVVPEDRAALRIARATAERTGQFRLEARIRRPDGTLRWIRKDGDLRNGPAGQPQRMIGTLADITAARQAEETGSLLASISATMQDALVTVDPEGRITTWNAAAERLFGHPATEVLGRDAAFLIPPAQRDEALRLAEAQARGKAVGAYDTRRLHRDGSEVDVSVTLSPVRDGAGRLRGSAALLRDIRERKRAEEELARSLDTYLSLIEMAPFGVILIDAEGRIVQVGRAAARWAQGSRLVGRGFEEAMTPFWPVALVERAGTLVRRTLRTGTPHSEVLTERRRDTGAVQTFDWSLHRVTLPDGRLGVVSYFFDLTERRRQEEQVELLLREVNHRSKNMLALIQSIARQTRATSPDEFVERFEQRLRSLAASQDLLTNSTWTSVDLEELLRRQMSCFGELAGGRIAPEGPALALKPAAAQTMGMVLHELATNACKYGALSDREGRIAIRWGVEAGRFRMEWREAGGPPVVSPGRTGFGSRVLGQVARASFDGEVRLDYQPDGLVWRLDCPADAMLCDVPGTAAAPPAPAPAAPAGLPRAPRRILLVEDEALIAADLAAALDEAGFSVVGPAAGCAEALALIERTGCDAAVLDVHLGAETSEPVARRLRALGLPFLVVSGYSRAQLPEALREAPLIPKPVDMQLLRAGLLAPGA